MEAEFVALDKSAEEVEWLRSFLEGIPLWPKPVTTVCIHYDSMATLTKAKNHIYNGKSIHIRRRHNTIKDLLRNGIISIDYVKSKENIVDPLTKGLCREQVIFTSRVEYYRIFLIGITYARLMRGRLFGNQMAKFSKILMNKDTFTIEINRTSLLIHGIVVLVEVETAVIILEKMTERGVFPGVYNVLISGLCKKGKLPAARNMLSKMLDQDIPPDRFIYATLIDGFARNEELDEAKKLFEHAIQKGVKLDVVRYNAIIKGYCKKDSWSPRVADGN
nr:pentatricopeptide repeat-containing protein At1g52620 [Tanacetum cinerariifolium]